MVRDLKGANTFFNRGAEELYGWKREEVIGCDLHSVLQTSFPIPREKIDAELAQRKRWQGNLI